MAKILFRTSGGRIREKELGLGHVFRCINLGYQLKPHQIQFLIEDYGSVSPLLHEHGFKKSFNLIPGISVFKSVPNPKDFIALSHFVKPMRLSIK